MKPHFTFIFKILLREVEYRKSKGDRAPTSNQTTETKAEPSVTEAEEDPSEDFSGDEYTDPIKPSKVSSVKTSAPKKRTKSNSWIFLKNRSLHFDHEENLGISTIKRKTPLLRTIVI